MEVINRLTIHGPFEVPGTVGIVQPSSLPIPVRIVVLVHTYVIRKPSCVQPVNWYFNKFMILVFNHVAISITNIPDHSAVKHTGSIPRTVHASSSRGRWSGT